VPMAPPSAIDPHQGLPSTIRAYRVLGRLAKGGTSDVVLACAEGPGGFERVVVLKLLLQQFRSDGRFERMFFNEAAAYARLSHPAIVRLYDFFAERDRLVLVLEHVDGLPLNKVNALLRATTGRLDDAACLFIAWRLFSALAAAHSARDPRTGEFGPVIHRDVNPSNLLLPWDGQVKLADFGMAKVSGLPAEDGVHLLRGAYGYVAPEQARGEEVTVRADVYVGCLLLWELLTGRKAIARSAPFGGGVDLAVRAPSFPALAALRPDLPRVLVDTVTRGLGTHPDSRGLTAEDVCNVLRTVADPEDGRRSLVETLSALRLPAAEEKLLATTPATQDVSTPVTSSVGEGMAPSHRPVSLSGHVPAQGAGAALWLSAALCVIAVCVAVGVRFQSRATPSAAAAPAPALASAASSAPAPSASASAAAPAAPIESHEATSGTITIPDSRAGHRVWIDDRLVGQAPGRYAVSCGAHSVRVGSQGEWQHVNVACDGDLLVQ
jgi:serine/threonine protein kinase